MMPVMLPLVDLVRALDDAVEVGLLAWWDDVSTQDGPLLFEVGTNEGRVYVFSPQDVT